MHRTRGGFSTGTRHACGDHLFSTREPLNPVQRPLACPNSDRDPATPSSFPTCPLSPFSYRLFHGQAPSRRPTLFNTTVSIVKKLHASCFPSLRAATYGTSHLFAVRLLLRPAPRISLPSRSQSTLCTRPFPSQPYCSHSRSVSSVLASEPSLQTPFFTTPTRTDIPHLFTSALVPPQWNCRHLQSLFV